jgi:hypothetical protein
MNISDIISIGSVLVAITALFRTFKKDRKETVKTRRHLSALKGIKLAIIGKWR